jgi:hypothetical protein
MNKLIKDGKVAVLYSPGYGAGWSTWGEGKDEEAKVFDVDLAEATLAQDFPRMEAVAKAKWPNTYLGGLRGLRVEWLPAGTAFRINEYDGYETVETLSDMKTFTA